MFSLQRIAAPSKEKQTDVDLLVGFLLSALAKTNSDQSRKARTLPFPLAVTSPCRCAYVSGCRAQTVMMADQDGRRLLTVFLAKATSFCPLTVELCLCFDALARRRAAHGPNPAEMA